MLVVALINDDIIRRSKVFYIFWLLKLHLVLYDLGICEYLKDLSVPVPSHITSDSYFINFFLKIYGKICIVVYPIFVIRRNDILIPDFFFLITDPDLSDIRL